MAQFELAIPKVLEHEGGYVNDPDDPGGETRYGISKRTYPNVDIANLTIEEATQIYRDDWWEEHKYWIIEDQDVATKILDLAVNMGARRAHRILQQALRASGEPVTVDGFVGPVTFAAVNRATPEVLLAAIRSEAAGYYRMLDKPKYLKGWLNRAYA